MDMNWLVADLRQYMGWDVPDGIAVKVLEQAKCEMPRGGGAAWMIWRAAQIIRNDGRPDDLRRLR